MKSLPFLFLVFLLTTVANAQPSFSTIRHPASLSDSLYKPVNFRVDSLTARATWEVPSILLLDENFESSDSLPAGWQFSSAGNSSWKVTTDATSLNMLITPHGKYIASSDFNAGQNNDGCCDYLITPALDLTQLDSVTLSFTSFYTGVFNEKAYVEISIDGGNTWQVLDTITPAANWWEQWKLYRIDLSEFSGITGSNSALVRFHANDSGQQASGWAVDDIKIQAFVTTLVNYSVWLDDSFIFNTVNTFWQFNTDTLHYGHMYKAEVAANYQLGSSVNDSAYFTNKYLPYPINLQASPNQTAVIVTWNPPLFGNTGMGSHFLYYKLYLDGVFYAMIPVTETSYWITNITEGDYSCTLTAVYDITSLGFPSQTGESAPAGPATCSYWLCCILPIFEDWTAGTFDLQQWQHGPNWIITNSEGDPAPAARFSSDPMLTNYSSALGLFDVVGTSQNTATPHDIILEFDLALLDSLGNGTENLSFQYKEYRGNWTTIASFDNLGNFGWTHYKFPLNFPRNSSWIGFQIVASGQNSTNIDHWLVDNISIYTKYTLNTATNLVATPISSSPQDIHVEWTTPLDTMIYKSTKSTNDLMQYELYRRSRYPQLSEWALISSITTTWYEDTNLPSNCYDYFVKAIYYEGGSNSNIDSINCISVGKKEEIAGEMKLFPNPAKHLMRVYLQENANGVIITNGLGETVRKVQVAGLKELELDVSSLSPGLYSMRITLNSGKSVVEKFVKTE